MHTPGTIRMQPAARAWRFFLTDSKFVFLRAMLNHDLNPAHNSHTDVAVSACSTQSCILRKKQRVFAWSTYRRPRGIEVMVIDGEALLENSAVLLRKVGVVFGRGIRRLGTRVAGRRAKAFQSSQEVTRRLFSHHKFALRTQ